MEQQTFGPMSNFFALHKRNRCSAQIVAALVTLGWRSSDFAAEDCKTVT